MRNIIRNSLNYCKKNPNVDIEKSSKKTKETQIVNQQLKQADFTRFEPPFTTPMFIPPPYTYVPGVVNPNPKEYLEAFDKYLKAQKETTKHGIRL